MASRLGVEDLELISLGAPILGTGGGGDPLIGKLIARTAIERWGDVRFLPLSEVPDGAVVIASAIMGAPTVFVEKIPNGTEAVRAFRALEAFLGRRAYATYSIEAGGLNSTIPIGTAARLGISLLDADGMGRAFPEVQMVSPTLYGMPATPMALADEKGNVVIIKETVTNLWTERFARTVTVDMGGSAMIALYPMLGRNAKRALIPQSISFARRIGRRLRSAWDAHASPLEALREETGGAIVFRGRLADLDRRTEGGFARGVGRFEGTDAYRHQELTIDFQNENLIARIGPRVLASVPDLISVLDAETGTPITTEGLRYGQRIAVLVIPCHPKWRTRKGLELVGPGYFGYAATYRPFRSGRE